MSEPKISANLVRLGRAVCYLLAIVAPPVLAGATGMSAAISDVYQPAATYSVNASASMPVVGYDPSKPTAVLVLSNAGSQVTDVLAPYEVLAATRAFNVYAAAPVKHSVPLGGGLDLLPQLSFAELDQRLNGKSPEVIVVPAMPGARREGTAGHAPVAEWLRSHAPAADTVLSVCNGAEVLGEAGLLEGRRVTANWAGIDTFHKRYPNAEWLRGVRYVEDGNLITTAGITSGVNGTLRVVSKHLGEDAATDLARKIGYPDQRLDDSPTIAAQRITISDGVLYTLMVGFNWGKDSVSAALTDGVGEIELASIIDVYPGQASAAKVTTLSAAGPNRPVTSRHGLTFIPRHGLDDAPPTDRVIVPGTHAVSATSSALHEWARDRGLEPQYIHANTEGQFPFDATLSDVALAESTAVAKFDAKALEYPTNHLHLSGPGWPLPLLLQPLGLALAGLVIAIAIDRWLSSRMKARRSGPRHDDHPKPQAARAVSKTLTSR